MIFKQNVEGTAWILLTAYTKMQEQHEMKKELLSKNESNVEIEKILSLSLLQKMRKVALQRTLSLWMNNHLIRRPWM